IPQLIERLGDCPMRCAESDDPNLGFARAVNNRRGEGRTRRVELAVEPQHIVLVIFGTFAVVRLLIVAATASEIRRFRMLGPGQRPVRNSVAINVLVTTESPQL